MCTPEDERDISPLPICVDLTCAQIQNFFPLIPGSDEVIVFPAERGNPVGKVAAVVEG